MKNLNQIDNEMLSRVIDDEGAIRPRRDTGFRMGMKASEFLTGENRFDASEQICAIINPGIIQMAFTQSQEATSLTPPAPADEDDELEMLAEKLALDARPSAPSADPDQEIEVEDMDGKISTVLASELETTGEGDPILEESDGLCVM